MANHNVTHLKTWKASQLPLRSKHTVRKALQRSVFTFTQLISVTFLLSCPVFAANPTDSVVVRTNSRFRASKIRIALAPMHQLLARLRFFHLQLLLLSTVSSYRTRFGTKLTVIKTSRTTSRLFKYSNRMLKTLSSASPSFGAKLVYRCSPFSIRPLTAKKSVI
jgi:hypothetical protein